jgi:hypothetical protein
LPPRGSPAMAANRSRDVAKAARRRKSGQ